MSTSNRRPVLVGLFVAVAIAILAGGILAVGNLHDTFTTKIRVSAVFHEVNGLQAGDNVWCSGLKVGVVDSLEFVDIERIQVDLLLGKEVAKFIHKDAKAHIGSDGLIGNPIVVLTGGTADTPALAEGDKLEIETVVSMSEVLATLQENNKNLVAITGDIKDVTAKIKAGEGTLGRLLAEDDLYASVGAMVDTLQAASGNARRLTASLAKFSADLNTEGNLPHELVTDQTLFTSIQTSVQQLQDATAKATEVVETVRQGASNPATPAGALLNDEKTGADLKATIAGVKDAAALLQEDLRALQSNFLFRPYFKKKEKEAKKAAERQRGD